MIRRRILAIFMLFIIIAAIPADEPAKSEVKTLVIKAYKPDNSIPTTSEEVQSARVIITDALSDRDLESLEVVGSSGIALDDYVQSFVGSTPQQMVFSYRIESKYVPLSNSENDTDTLNISFSITPFYLDGNSNAGDGERIDASFSLTQETLNFSDNLSTSHSLPDSERHYLGFFFIPIYCTHTNRSISLSYGNDNNLSDDTSNNSAVLNRQINVTASCKKESSPNPFQCDENFFDQSEYPDLPLWIARGAVMMSIDKSDYTNAQEGKYIATVTVNLTSS